jgi:anthranilate synthase/aminodeoxychorismate synthase-like glutamine amidotransferase
MVLIIDNYDSFTYNLVQYFQCLQRPVSVYLNDQITIEELEALNPKYLVISPGPNSPKQAGISLAVIKHFAKTHPILGVCLGHQALGQAFGARIISAPTIMHGKTSMLVHQQRGLFSGLPSNFRVARYHSLTIDEATLPWDFQVDAYADNTIMAISHRKLPLFGVQFHPEAILTEYGMEILRNFLSYSYERNI